MLSIMHAKDVLRMSLIFKIFSRTIIVILGDRAVTKMQKMTQFYKN